MEDAGCVNIECRHSRFGIVSSIVGILSFFVASFYFFRFALWLMENEVLLKNPKAIEGIQIPQNVMTAIYVIVAMTLIGLVCGLLGLIEKKRKRVFPIIGSCLNGILLFLISIKL